MLARSLVLTACLLTAAVAIGRSVHEQPVLKAQFSEMPMAVDQWAGANAERFSPEVIRIAGVDEYLHRKYVNGGKQPLWLYVGFYGSQADGRTMHSPLNCFPGSGWEPAEHARLPLDVEAGPQKRTVEINRLIVRRGTDRQLVLYWYQLHGRVVPSEYWSKAFTVLDAISLRRSDGAIVRIVTPIVGDEAAATAAATEFVSRIFPSLTRVLPS